MINKVYTPQNTKEALAKRYVQSRLTKFQYILCKLEQLSILPKYLILCIILIVFVPMDIVIMMKLSDINKLYGIGFPLVCTVFIIAVKTLIKKSYASVPEVAYFIEGQYTTYLGLAKDYTITNEMGIDIVAKGDIVVHNKTYLCYEHNGKTYKCDNFMLDSLERIKNNSEELVAVINIVNFDVVVALSCINMTKAAFLTNEQKKETMCEPLNDIDSQVPIDIYNRKGKDFFDTDESLKYCDGERIINLPVNEKRNVITTLQKDVYRYYIKEVDTRVVDCGDLKYITTEFSKKHKVHILAKFNQKNVDCAYLYKETFERIKGNPAEKLVIFDYAHIYYGVALSYIKEAKS